MPIVLVGRKEQSVVVRWPQFLGLTCCLGALLGLGCGAVFALMAGRWSHGVALFGFVMGIALGGVGLLGGLLTPIERLTPVD